MGSAQTCGVASAVHRAHAVDAVLTAGGVGFRAARTHKELLGARLFGSGALRDAIAGLRNGHD